MATTSVNELFFDLDGSTGLPSIETQLLATTGASKVSLIGIVRPHISAATGSKLMDLEVRIELSNDGSIWVDSGITPVTKPYTAGASLPHQFAPEKISLFGDVKGAAYVRAVYELKTADTTLQGTLLVTATLSVGL